MTTQDLLASSEVLSAHIDRAQGPARLSMQPELQKVLAQLKARGVAVPARLRALDACLTDEAIEARFDNMPV